MIDADRLAGWSLRLRIFLFFALIALAGAAAVVAGAVLGHGRVVEGDAAPAAGFVVGAVTSILALWGVTAWIWLLFDRNVARPVEHLASEMRARAHAGVDGRIDRAPARYLGDLAPAACAVATDLSEKRARMAEEVAERSASAADRAAHMEAIFWEAPAPLLLCTADHRVAGFNRAAAELFGPEPPLGLDRPLTQFLDARPVAAARDRTVDPDAPDEATLELSRATGGSDDDDAPVLNARLRPAPTGPLNAETDPTGCYTLSFETGRPMTAPRLDAGGQSPAGEHADLELLRRPPPAAAETPFHRLSFVVLDTETTGLEPARGDEILQIAGVRVVNGRRMLGDVFDRLVNPERSVPAASTAVHGVTEEMVRDAPTIAEVGRSFHRFCGDAVLIAHNAPFDMAFFRKHEARIGAVFDQPVLDTVLLSAIAFGRAAELSLDAICARLQVDLPAEVRHTALGDAMATAEAFLKLTPMLQAKGLTTLGQVRAACARHSALLEDATRRPDSEAAPSGGTRPAAVSRLAEEGPDRLGAHPPRH